MGFKNNFSKATQNDNLKPEGDYEVLVMKIEERVTPKGKTGLNLSMVIRNDVEQPYQNGFIFHTLWKRREPTAEDMQVNGYGFGQMMALAQAACLPDGKDYADLGEFLGEIAKKPLRVTVKHEVYQNVKRERVSFLQATQFPQVRHVFKQKASPDAYAAPPTQTTYAAQAAQAAGYAAPPITDDDIPF